MPLKLPKDVSGSENADDKGEYDNLNHVTNHVVERVNSSLRMVQSEWSKLENIFGDWIATLLDALGLKITSVRRLNWCQIIDTELTTHFKDKIR